MSGFVLNRVDTALHLLHYYLLADSESRWRVKTEKQTRESLGVFFVCVLWRISSLVRVCVLKWFGYLRYTIASAVFRSTLTLSAFLPCFRFHSVVVMYTDDNERVKKEQTTLVEQHIKYPCSRRRRRRRPRQRRTKRKRNLCCFTQYYGGVEWIRWQMRAPKIHTDTIQKPYFVTLGQNFDIYDAIKFRDYDLWFVCTRRRSQHSIRDNIEWQSFRINKLLAMRTTHSEPFYEIRLQLHSVVVPFSQSATAIASPNSKQLNKLFNTFYGWDNNIYYFFCANRATASVYSLCECLGHRRQCHTLIRSFIQQTKQA